MGGDYVMVELKKKTIYACPTYVTITIISSLSFMIASFLALCLLSNWLIAIIVSPILFLFEFLLHYYSAPSAFVRITLSDDGVQYDSWNIKWEEIKCVEVFSEIEIIWGILRNHPVNIGLALSLFGTKTDYKTHDIRLVIEKSDTVHSFFLRYCKNYSEISNEVNDNPPVLSLKSTVVLMAIAMVLSITLLFFTSWISALISFFLTFSAEVHFLSESYLARLSRR